jgi:O-antigen ligase
VTEPVPPTSTDGAWAPLVLTAAVLALVPLSIAPGLVLYYDVTPRAVALCALAALLCFWFVPAWEAVRRSPRLLAIVAMQGGSLLLSTIFSTSAARSVSGTNWRRFGAPVQLSLLLCFLVLLYVVARRRDGARILLQVASLTLLAVSAYGVCQYLEVDPLLQGQLYSVGQYNQPILRPVSTLGSGPGLGNFAMMGVFLALASAGSDSARHWHIVALAAAASGCLAVLLSGTRSAMLGLAVGLALLGVRRARRLATRQTAVACCAAAVLLGCFCVAPAGRYLRNRAVQAAGDWKGGTRPWLWRDCLPMLLQHPLTGYGLDTFAASFPRYQSRELAAAYPDSYNESPHNLLLDVWISQGILGIAPFVALLALAGACGWRRRDSAVSDSALAGLAAAVAAFQFFPLEIATAMSLYFLLALLLAPEIRTGPRALTSRRRLWPRLCEGWAATLLLLFAVQMAVADHKFARAQRALGAGAIEHAIGEFESARRWAPPAFNASLWFSRALLSAAARNGAPRNSLAPAERFAADACRNAEDPHNACYYLAVIESQRGDLTGAAAVLRDCIRLAPSWYAPYWSLAQVDLLLGKRDEARQMAITALELSGSHGAEIEPLLRR